MALVLPDFHGSGKLSRLWPVSQKAMFLILKWCVMKRTGLGGFEPPTSGLEARRYVQAKPQAQRTAIKVRVH